ncbi:SDR family oxidoreductase [Burkholderia pseudomallei]|uniref:SDR family oxidoreductase n=1 Tax=Burkholderia pseudomallei TaxID=28450 RepID=UPI00018A568D|nr:SDR family oxidoreductase [Burkholderia pseudomallei]AIO95691.1 short chain dehydrogenase family protein [Burkholderia pseudomallei 576]EEC35204.1 3-oxoacyl-[acyl-carrier-protein] reductase [Burkholderia pseudomallei 576]KGD28307.1 short chain dehydrogenase family protein [Burkholderia pseudomallei]VBT50785.1 short-chain dehydrogenase/reductase SDR [Burkholderia pseudomallei]
MTQLKTAIVTGASRGIGAGIAQQLAADGHAVIVNYAGSRDSADAVVRSILDAGGQAVATQGDVSRAEDVTRLFDAAERAFGRVDVVVNNAGRAIRKPLAEFTEAEFDAVLATNLKGVFLMLREASLRLKDNGRIVNISASFQGGPIIGYGPYAASKMAIEKLTEVAAKELGGRNITVNSIRPGPTRTDLFMTGKNDELVKQFAAQSVLGRIGEPVDVARVVSFLVGADGGWVTGQSFGANGGYW